MVKRPPHVHQTYNTKVKRLKHCPNVLHKSESCTAARDPRHQQQGADIINTYIRYKTYTYTYAKGTTQLNTTQLDTPQVNSTQLTTKLQTTQHQ